MDLPTKGNKAGREDFLANLDEPPKEKAQAILEQQKARTITQDEAQSQLAELGVTFHLKEIRVAAAIS
ncbi:hypothetical protein [Ureibacillus sp. GCM10028918]|uniref:hypothetical protein n=1 Tax=Ureibacillus sp. GCM10028918 TaxID=3273429 RepID=UPI003607EE0D